MEWLSNNLFAHADRTNTIIRLGCWKFQLQVISGAYQQMFSSQTFTSIGVYVCVRAGCVCVCGGGVIECYTWHSGAGVLWIHIYKLVCRAETRGRESRLRHGHVLACQLFCPCGLRAGWVSGGLTADDASTCMNVFCDSVVANETTCNKKKDC